MLCDLNPIRPSAKHFATLSEGDPHTIFGFGAIYSTLKLYFNDSWFAFKVQWVFNCKEPSVAHRVSHTFYDAEKTV